MNFKLTVTCEHCEKDVVININEPDNGYLDCPFCLNDINIATEWKELWKICREIK